MERNTKIYTEVYMTLSSLNKGIIDKIPKKLKQAIFSNADTSFPYKIKDLLPESRVIIAAIFERYLSN